jgi:hypothetical protein
MSSEYFSSCLHQKERRTFKLEKECLKRLKKTIPSQDKVLLKNATFTLAKMRMSKNLKSAS